MAIDNTSDRSSVDAALRWIGDLDHPFYQDERQRFVWYEASAVGFQLLMILQLLVTGATMVVFGKDAFVYAIVALAPVVLTAIVVMAYTHRRGAQYFAQFSDLRRSRGMLGIALIGLLVIGALRAGAQDEAGIGSDWNLGILFGLGAVVGLAAPFVLSKIGQRKRSADDLD